MKEYQYSYLKIKRPMWQYVIATAVLSAFLVAISLGIFFFSVSHGSTSEMYVFDKLDISGAKHSDTAMRKMMNPDSEVRGVWIATVGNINFPSEPGLSADELKAEIDDIVKTVLENGLNTIFFQVRPSSDALYNSRYFPISEFLAKSQDAGLPDGVDIFEYLIDTAHEAGVAVHAWVNPLRVTYGNETNPQHNVELLGATNPARMHPEWTVAYDDGKLYYNAGIPEVRQLIIDGVEEIVTKYNVDGVVFDDYFYPYPKSGSVFDDDEAYALYGGEFDSRADWRRDNVNKIIEGCYKAVKENSTECLFGVSPFGIWQNNDGRNGGSDTKGLNAFSEIYCDALAWVKGGYVDYIAPQLYWRFSTESARFDVLVRWWNAQLEGSDVDLLISHAAYQSASWDSDSEIAEQVEFSRSELSYKGSLFYGYEAIRNNEQKLNDQLSSLYSYEIVYTDIVSNEAQIEVTSPANGATVNSDSTYIIGYSDPSEPLYLNGRKIGRTKRGYFSAYVQLNEGKNVFTFEHKGETYDYTVYKGSASSSQGSAVIMDTPYIQAVSPFGNTALGAGSELVLTAYAPAGSSVSAKIGDETVKMYSLGVAKESKESINRDTYSASYSLPQEVTANTIIDLGEIIFTAEYKGESYAVSGGGLRVLGDGAVIPIEVVNSDSHLKISPDSWYYDDYTPASPGMTDNAVSLENGYYHLRMGGYISEGNAVELEPSNIISNANISSASVSNEGKYTYLRIKADVKVPVNSYVEEGNFVFTLYNVSLRDGLLDGIPEVNVEKNPLFDGSGIVLGARENSIRYTLSLKNTDNFYGYSIYYQDDEIVVRFINPSSLDTESETPLKDKVIVLDAGHGGKDYGALGADPKYNEKDLNLAIVLSAEQMLTQLGAKVILIRNEDTTVELTDRIAYLNEMDLDLCVSVHQNSMDYSADITKIRGLLSLYYADAGSLLAKALSVEMSDSLLRYERSTSRQRLAMVRNHKFPSALVEVGFITCVEEYDMMISSGGVERAAQGIVRGILSWYAAQSEFIEQ